MDYQYPAYGARSILPHAVGRIALLASVTAVLAVSASTSVPAAYLQSLPAGAEISGIALDGDGNILVAGSILPPGGDYRSRDAFVAKYSPDAQTRLYFVLLAGSDSDYAGAVAADASGNAYVAGTTSSVDFPTSPNALEATPNGATAVGFVVKLDPSGKIVFSTMFGGGNQQSTGVGGMALSPSGDVFLTGQTVGGNFTTTPSPIQPSRTFNTFYVARLSAAGDRVIYAVAGIGGHAVAADEQNNAYILGSSFDPVNDVPVTPNAFQTAVQPTICAATRAFGLFCAHQYVAKLDSTGTGIIFCTFVSGTYGDAPAQIAIDSNHDIYVTGSTGSTDYPTTAGAFETQNNVLVPPAPPGWDSFAYGVYEAFPNTAYVTKLASDGTHLSYSTLLGSTDMDSATAIALDAENRAYVALSLQSPDFPDLPAGPPRCRPDHGRRMPTLLQLDAAGASISALSLIEGVQPGYSGPVLAVNEQRAILAGGGYLAQVVPGTPVSKDAITCITDAADFAQSGPVAAGQLLTVFGTAIGPASPLTADVSQALPMSLGGASVLVNGIAAPLLYASQNQINFQVPPAVTGQPYATVQVAGAQRVLPIAASIPSLFTGVALGYPLCDGRVVNAVPVTVLNQDGSLNSCDNPATNGSLISVLLNGAGDGQPVFPNNIEAPFGVVSVTLLDAGIPDVWQVKMQATGATVATLSLRVNGVSVRESGFVVWVAQSQ